MSYELFISLRYLFGKRKQIYLWVITAISVCGIAVGVASLIVTLAVMTGFHTDLKSRILNVHSHIILQARVKEEEAEKTIKKILDLKEVNSCSPFILTQAMLKARGVTRGAAVKGVKPSSISGSELSKYLLKGKWESLDNGACIIGKELAGGLGINLGDEVYLISSEGILKRWGMVPKLKKIKIGGIFSSGMYEYDSALVFIGMKGAQKLFNYSGQVSGLEIRLNDPEQAIRLKEKIREVLGSTGWWIKTWQDLNRNFFAALKLEKTVMFIILVLIILVAAFGIFSTLILVTLEKIKDIGVLRALGVSKGSIRKIFFWQGSLIGLTGTIVGVIFGIFLSYLLAKYQFIKLPQDVYYISYLPVKLVARDITAVSLSGILISLLATLYPSYLAAKLDPCQALRYE